MLFIVNKSILCIVVVVGVSEARELMVVFGAMQVLFRFVLDGLMVVFCLYVAGVVIVVLYVMVSVGISLIVDRFVMHLSVEVCRKEGLFVGSHYC
jgi:hypothetical protein